MLKPLKILIINDSQDNADLILKELLQAGYDCQWKRVETTEDMRESLKENWDAILSDCHCSLKRFNGQSALEIIKETDVDVPFIVVSGANDGEKTVCLLKDRIPNFFLDKKIDSICPAIEKEIIDCQERKAHKLEQENLKKSEAKNKAILSAIPDIIFVYDRQGNFLDYYASDVKKLFLTPEQFLGKNIKDIFPKDLTIKLFSSFDLAIKTKRPQVVEFGFLVDGVIKWFETRIIVSNCERVLGLVRDITDRRISEETIRTHLQRLAALRSIDMAIASTMDVRVTMSVILDHMTTLMHVDAACILLSDPQTQILEYASGRGFKYADITKSKLQFGEGFAGRAFMEQKHIFIKNIIDDELNYSEKYKKYLMEKENFISYMAMPLVIKGFPIGVLEIFNRSQLEIDNDWMDFLYVLVGQATIAIENTSLFDKLNKSNRALEISYDTTLEGWVRVLDLKDEETEGHTRRVTDMAIELADLVGVDKRDIVQVRRGSLLHDIGKMGIPDKILLKPGPLTDEEWEIMKMHPVYAYEILSPIPYLKNVIDIPYCHHEKWDGTGYPRGLSGTEIPLFARIFATVDIWDAITSDRCYRKAWDKERALKHMKTISGEHLDPNIVKIFLEMI